MERNPWLLINSPIGTAACREIEHDALVVVPWTVERYPGSAVASLNHHCCPRWNIVWYFVSRIGDADDDVVPR
jgi:hypothetical protein